MNFFYRFLNKILFHFNHRFYLKQWIIGFAEGDIRDIIRSKKFEFDIKWISQKEYDCFHADPFFLGKEDGEISLLIEEYRNDDHYGKIALFVTDTLFKSVKSKIVLDTKSHLSYPFVFRENGKVYVIPESSKAGSLSCYEYDAYKQDMKFVKDLINLPLLDSNLFKYRDKYWIIGSLRKENGVYELYIFYSDYLLGPYQPHEQNPIKNGMDGVRGAGKIIEVDGEFYRPTQNCAEEYGKDITINKITRLDEKNYEWEYYMKISLDKKRKANRGIMNLHTINSIGSLIAVDGRKWTFSPLKQNKVVNEENAYFRKDS